MHLCGYDPSLGRYAGPARGEWHMRGAGAAFPVSHPSDADISSM